MSRRGPASCAVGTLCVGACMVRDSNDVCWMQSSLRGTRRRSSLNELWTGLQAEGVTRSCRLRYGLLGGARMQDRRRNRLYTRQEKQRKQTNSWALVMRGGDPSWHDCPSGVSQVSMCCKAFMTAVVVMVQRAGKGGN